jgi:carbonic anhydrase
VRDFEDLLAANADYAAGFELAGRPAHAARGLAVVTCMDSRIEPLGMVGLVPGDAKIIRNAGGRITDDVLRSLVLATQILGVQRVAVVHHTRCAMHGDEADLAARVGDHAGLTCDIDLGTFSDHLESLADDIARLRGHHLLPDDLVVGGFLYDVDSGRIDQLC